jgi:hypothetical protein
MAKDSRISSRSEVREAPLRVIIRDSARDFVATLVKKASEREEPATPSFNDQDQQKITELTNKLKEKYSGKRN